MEYRPIMSACAVVEGSMGETSDPLFGDLDRRSITHEDGAWMTRVVGIHRTRRVAWVQIATSDDEETVLLRFLPGAKPDTALAALKTWSRMSLAERPHIVDVPRVM
jgi:hypothetical protein